MSPEQLSMLTSLVGFIKLLSSWPFAVFFFVLVIGPWLLAVFLAWAHKKRLDAAIAMYEHNVRLVEKYEEVAIDLKDVIVLNTQTMTTLVECIRRTK